MRSVDSRTAVPVSPSMPLLVRVRIQRFFLSITDVFLVNACGCVFAVHACAACMCRTLPLTSSKFTPVHSTAAPHPWPACMGNLASRRRSSTGAQRGHIWVQTNREIQIEKLQNLWDYAPHCATTGTSNAPRQMKSFPLNTVASMLFHVLQWYTVAALNIGSLGLNFRV